LQLAGKLLTADHVNILQAGIRNNSTLTLTIKTKGGLDIRA
jgi:hypothetical protein